MLFFGHLGIGYRIGSAFRRRPLARVDVGCLLLGTIAPDLIDKSMFFASDWLFVHPPLLADPFISGTRTLGHTIGFTLLVAAAARLRRTSALGYFALGMATHLFLDCFTYLLGHKTHTLAYVLGVMTWPVSGWQFPVRLWTWHPFRLMGIFTGQPWMWVMEAFGLWCLRPVFRSNASSSGLRRAPRGIRGAF